MPMGSLEILSVKYYENHWNNFVGQFETSPGMHCPSVGSAWRHDTCADDVHVSSIPVVTSTCISGDDDGYVWR